MRRPEGRPPYGAIEEKREEQGRAAALPQRRGRSRAPPLRTSHSHCGGSGRLAAHNERRQPAKLARSCGCLPRRGKHCSPPQFRFAQLWPLTHNPAPRRNSGNFLWFFLLLAKERITFREAAVSGLPQTQIRQNIRPCVQRQRRNSAYPLGCHIGR